MIETLILGFLLGMITTGAGAAYAASKLLNKHYVIREFPSGYSVAYIDIGVDNDPYGCVALKKGKNIIAAIKFDKKGITDIEYDI